MESLCQKRWKNAEHEKKRKVRKQQLIGHQTGSNSDTEARNHNYTEDFFKSVGRNVKINNTSW